jgi:Polysaccharide lyase
MSAAAIADPIFTDDFESGSLNKTENGVKWGGGTSTAVSTDIAHSGTHSLRFSFAAGGSGTDADAEQRFGLGKEYNEVDIQFYAYYPDGTEGLGARYVHRDESPGNNKFIRIWKGNTADGNQGYTDQYVKAGVSTWPSGSGDSDLGGEIGTDTKPTGQYNASMKSRAIDDTVRGKWTLFRIHMKASSGTNKNDGIIEMWKNGTQIFSSKDLALYASNGTTPAFEYGYLLGWSNSGFAAATRIYIDDVQISTSAQAVASIPRPPTDVRAQ